MEPLPTLRREQLDEFLPRIRSGALMGMIERIDLDAFLLILDQRAGAQNQFITNGAQAAKLHSADVQLDVTHRYIASMLRKWLDDEYLVSRSVPIASEITEWLYSCEKRLRSHFPGVPFEIDKIVAMALDFEARAGSAGIPAVGNQAGTP